MKKFERILATLGLSALVLAGCDASVGGDADAVGGDDATTDAISGTDATTDTGTDTGTDTVAPTTFAYATIDGTPAKEPDCNATTSPGPDIDAIALYGADGKLKGVARKGSAVFKEGATVLCPDKTEHKNHADVEGPLNTDATASKGYMGLRQGTVEFQFGACTTATEKVTECDGAGAVVEILPGDEIDVYEVDYTFQTETACKANTAATDKSACGLGEQSGLITGSCKCLPEDYAVYVHKSAGSVNVDGVALGTFTGTKFHIAIPK